LLRIIAKQAMIRYENMQLLGLSTISTLKKHCFGAKYYHGAVDATAIIGEILSLAVLELDVQLLR
jgi:hypothetical protein